MDIERLQMHTDDAVAPRGYLDHITEIKLRTLDQLTSEALRGNTRCSIFLRQRTDVIRKIQTKLAVVVEGRAHPVARRWQRGLMTA